MGDEGHRGRRWKLRGHGRWQGDRVEAACKQQRCPQSLPARTSAKCPPPRQAPGPHNGVCAAATPARERIWDLCPALDRGTGLGVTEGTQEMEVMLGSLTLEWGGVHTGPWPPRWQQGAAGQQLGGCQGCTRGSPIPTASRTQTRSATLNPTPPAQPPPSKWVTELALTYHLLRARCGVSAARGDPNPTRYCTRSPRPW